MKPSNDVMKLKVLLPTEILVDCSVTKVIAEAENGSFCILPRHIDCVAALVPGIFSFVTLSGKTRFLAIHEGILVKQRKDIFVSTLNGFQDEDLATLKKTIDEKFRILDEQERLTRSALAQFEISIIKHFKNL